MAGAAATAAPAGASPPGSTSYLVGCGIGDVTGAVAGQGMMGYSNPEQVAAGLLQRCWARAYIIVDPATGRVIDVHHPLHGVCLTGGVLFMPTSRGSCTGSGVLLDLILTGRAPSALVFCEAEDVLTLGALIAAEMFGKPLPVLRLRPSSSRPGWGSASA